MIQITPQMRIVVAVEPVDLRKGIDAGNPETEAAPVWRKVG
jgi:hypothetical protein